MKSSVTLGLIYPAVYVPPRSPNMDPVIEKFALKMICCSKKWANFFLPHSRNLVHFISRFSCIQNIVPCSN